MNDSQTQHYDDDIELIDLFRVIWKWRLFIITGTVVCVILALAYGLSRKKVYAVGMTVQPGIMYTSNGGAKRVLVDSIDSIVGKITAGIYDDQIIEKAISRPVEEKPQDLKFDVNAPSQADVVQVRYETPDIQEGMAILHELFKLLQCQEHSMIESLVDKLNRQIILDKIDLEKNKSIENSYHANIKNIDRRIRELESDIEVIKANSGYLDDQRKKLLDRDTNAEGALSVLLYSNTIQQNIQFVNAVKKDLNEHRMLRERELQKVIEEKNNQKKIAENIYTNEKIRDNILKMSLIRPPTPEKNFVKPRIKILAVVSAVAGFFGMIFFSFLLEYFKNNPISSPDELACENG